MLMKKVPPYMAIAFLVTAPLVNPITVWATATAFGYNLSITLIRVGMAIIVGIIVALGVSKFFPTLELLFNSKAFQESEAAATDFENAQYSGEKRPQIGKDALELETAAYVATESHHHYQSSMLADIFDHANEEFLEVGKFLIIGAFIASVVQIAIPKESLMIITQNPALSVIVMMLLALSLSLCAEADAFVARSFTYHFPLGSVMGFMVFGQMLDIKNTALLLKSFKPKVILGNH
jgi:uncharacterized protein